MAEAKVPNALSVTSVEKALSTLCSAAKNQPGNQSEIFKIITHIPAITEAYLPFPLDSGFEDGDVNQEAGELFKAMAKHNGIELKSLFRDEDKYFEHQKGERICVTLKHLILLGGPEYTKKKIMDILSHEAYLLVQSIMDYTESFSEMGKNIIKLVEKIKKLALAAVEGIFLCDQLNLTSNEQMNIISNMILEKLSTELLTVIDSLKETLPKPTTPSVTRSSGGFFATQPITNDTSDSLVDQTDLVLLADILYSFLDLEISLRDLHLKLHGDGQKSDGARKSSLKQRSTLPDILRSSQEASWIRSTHIYGDWDWQEVLKEIGPLITKSISHVFEQCQDEELRNMRSSFSPEQSSILETTDSVSLTIYSNLVTPKRILKSFEIALTLIKSLCPFAILGSHYKPLSNVMSCYIDECNQLLKALKSIITAAYNDFPEKITIPSMCSCLATCEDINVVLGFCALRINVEPRPPFQGTLQTYKDLEKTLRDMIVMNLNSRIRCYVLHDAEGDHFCDPKEFADGETCSYSISNWKHFSDRIWRDFTSSMSDHSRNSIFSEIFMNSLQVLVLRYVGCEPSYNRTKQLLLDIPTIVEFCRQVINGDVFQAIVFPFTESQVKTINASCSMLKNVLCLVSGPLDILEKYISIPDEEHEKAEIYKPSDEIWQSCIYHQDDTMNSMALASYLFGLFSNDYSLLKSLISEDFLRNLEEPSRGEIVHDVYSLLASCSSLRSDVFFHCAFHSVQKSPESIFLILTSHKGSNADPKHPWCKVFFDELYDILCESLRISALYLCSSAWTSLGSNIIESLPLEIKSMLLNVSASNKSTEKMKYLATGVMLAVQGLKQAIYLFPEWLTLFLIQLESRHQGDLDQFGSVPFYILVKATYNVLSRSEIWDRYYYMDFTKEGLDMMHQAGQYFMKMSMKEFKPANDTENMVKNHIHVLKKEMDECFKELVLDTDYECSNEQLFELCKLKIVHLTSYDPEALKCIKRIKMAVCSNRKQLLACINKDSDAGNDIVDGVAAFKWEELFKNTLNNLDDDSVKHLISHRWEMREGAFLNENEAVLVRNVKSILYPE